MSVVLRIYLSTVVYAVYAVYAVVDSSGVQDKKCCGSLVDCEPFRLGYQLIHGVELLYIV